MIRLLLLVIGINLNYSSYCQVVLKFTYGCSFSGEPSKKQVTTFDSEKDIEYALARIMKYTGLPQNFTLKSGDVPNAQANTIGSTRYIIYNQSFMNRIISSTGNDWAAISILAHEIGHHLCYHLLDDVSNRYNKELEADLFSGFVLCKMGASIKDAITAVSSIASEEGSPTHPPRSARIASITKGWMQAKEGFDSAPVSTSKVNTETSSSANPANREELFSIYRTNSRQGSENYKNQQYAAALSNFKQCISSYENLIKLGYINKVGFDTTATSNAAICAELTGKIEEAAFYYEILAENKVTAKDFDRIYKWLVQFYKKRGDILKTMKFLTLGRQLYPMDTFWDNFELDILIEEKDYNKIFAKYEQIIRENPNEPIFRFNYGVDLFTAAISEDSGKRPANSKELFAKAIEQFQIARSNGYNDYNLNQALGAIYYSLGRDYHNEAKEIPLNSSGSDLITRKRLIEERDKNFDLAISYFLIVEQLLKDKKQLLVAQKEALKRAFDLLMVMYNSMGNTLKGAEYEIKLKVLK